MRIIAGVHKGRSISSPKGDATRPTTDRVRESVMSSIESIRGGFDGANVLDAFAGSGALGLESLSRGADEVVFCDIDAAAIDVLRDNSRKLGYSDKVAKIMRHDTLKYGFVHTDKPYDLVFLDPPYKLEADRVFEIINRSLEAKTLNNGCVIVYEHNATENDSIDRILRNTDITHLRRKKYGATFVDYFEV